MDITNFDLSQIDLTRTTFHSDVYGKDFPRLVPCLAQERAYVKLDSLPKSVIEQALPKFEESIPGISHNLKNLATKEFYEDPNYQQLYRFRTQINNPEEHLLFLFFRNAHIDPTLDKYLEAMQESFILRECADCRSLDKIIRKEFATQFDNSLKQGQALFGRQEQDFPYIGRKDIFQRYLKNRMSIIFDVLVKMKSEGLSPDKVFKTAESNRVYPLFQYKDCLLLKNARDSFK